MEKIDVEFFGTLLNTKTEDVEQAITDGTLGEKVKALKLMNEADVTTMKANFAKEVKEKHISELVKSAKGGNIDKDLYDVIKGGVIQKTERTLSKEHGITEFDGINDLVLKAISKNKGHTDDTKIQELDQKVLDLQGRNTQLVDDKDKAVDDANKKADDRVLSRDKRDLVNAVPFDLSDVDQNDLEKITGQRRQIVESVFDARYVLSFEGENVVVKDKEGKIQKDPNTYEPIAPLDVIKLIPVELGIKIKSPDTGGQGGSSSGSNGSAPFKNQAEFNQYCEDNKIHPTSKEGIKLFAERGRGIK